MIKKVIVALAVVAFSAASASAATFKGMFDVSLNSGSGLIVNANPSSGMIDVDLEVGESAKVFLFNLWTDETAINKDDKKAKPISVDFAFSSPVANGAVDGTTVGKVSHLDFFQYGYVDWSDPLVLGFGDGGKFTVTLVDSKFNKGWFWGTTPGEKYGTEVWAHISYDMAPIPLPAAGFLLLAGMGGLVAMRRKRAA